MRQRVCQRPVQRCSRLSWRLRHVPAHMPVRWLVVRGSPKLHGGRLPHGNGLLLSVHALLVRRRWLPDDSMHVRREPRVRLWWNRLHWAVPPCLPVRRNVDTVWRKRVLMRTAPVRWNRRQHL